MIKLTSIDMQFLVKESFACEVNKFSWQVNVENWKFIRQKLKTEVYNLRNLLCHYWMQKSHKTSLIRCFSDVSIFTSTSRHVLIKYWNGRKRFQCTYVKPSLEVNGVKRLLTLWHRRRIVECLQCQYVPQTDDDRMCAHSKCTLSSLTLCACISMSPLSIVWPHTMFMRCLKPKLQWIFYYSDKFPISLKINQICRLLFPSHNLIYRRINVFFIFLCLNRTRKELKFLKICARFSRKTFCDNNRLSWNLLLFL